MKDGEGHLHTRILVAVGIHDGQNVKVEMVKQLLYSGIRFIAVDKLVDNIKCCGRCYPLSGVDSGIYPDDAFLDSWGSLPGELDDEECPVLVALADVDQGDHVRVVLLQSFQFSVDILQRVVLVVGVSSRLRVVEGGRGLLILDCSKHVPFRWNLSLTNCSRSLTATT